MSNVLTICTTCAATGAAPLGTELAAALGDVSGWHVRTHACLSICARPIAIALQGEGKATYLFADIALSDVADLHATLAAYDAAPDGWIEDARPLGRLRLCLKGRVPARVMAP